MIHLKGHAAFITGSSVGVGLALAEALAEHGADVILHDRAGGTEEAAMAKVRAHGVQSGFVAGDLLQDPETAADQIVNAALAIHSKIDILINSAGGALFDVPYEQMTAQRFEDSFRLNVTAPYFITQRFSRHWIACKTAGRVIMIGSINGRLAEQDSTAYDIAKGAVEMMVKSLAVSLAPHNIRVNGIAPGMVLSPRTMWAVTRPQDGDWIRKHTPNGQIPPADALGGAAVYLASDSAYHTTGHMLMVDGGMSAWQHPFLERAVR